MFFHIDEQPKDYGINAALALRPILYSVSFWPSMQPLSFASKLFYMQTKSRFQKVAAFRSSFPHRRRRQWVSYFYYGCLYNRTVCVIMRCPVVNNVAMLHLAWQHKIIPAS